MKKSKKKYFEQQLAKLSEEQRRMLYKRAANLRKAAQINARKNRRHVRKEFNAKGNHEHLPMFQKHTKVDKLTIDDCALRVLEEDGINIIIEATQYGEEIEDYSQSRKGVIAFVGSKGCEVQVGDEVYECLLGPNFSMTQKSDIAVGDKVHFAFSKDGTAVVQSVIPRKNKLSRPDPTKHEIERVIAANIDVVVIVASIRQPLLKPSLIDRYLIAAQKGGVEAYICVNKMDLLEAGDKESELEILEPYKEIGVKIFECSSKRGKQGVESLLDSLKGKLCVFVGHSGTGKSSILNALKPEIEAEVGEVHETTGLGRHTTTHSMLHDVRDDVWVIDTPGIREFGLWAMDAEDLKWYFDEFDQFAEKCRFSNCSHTHEPDCAVKEALLEGEITQLRYDSYIRILESLQENQNKW